MPPDSTPPAAAPSPRPRSLKRLARNAVARALGDERYTEFHAFRWLATRRDERRAPQPLGFKVAAWRQGFHAGHLAVYDPAGVARGEYLTDYARHHRCEHINPLPALFNNKLLLQRLLADRGIAQSELIALVSRREIVADPLGDARRVEAAELEGRLLAEGGRYIVKPQIGSFGSEVLLVEARDGRLVARKGRATRPFALRGVRPVSLVERAVEQHAFWQALSPYSVNTMRILTMWTPGDSDPFVARAVQRVGTEDTLPTDNWSGGGVCARVDLDTGELGVGRVNPSQSGRKDLPYTHHPDTGAPITGLVLPYWGRIKCAVLAAARSLPYANYVGWDVAVDASGTPLVIEGNSNTSVDLLQVHGGLLVDPAIRRFYEVCGVI